MGAGKNKSHRKKRISKHVLQAEERKKIAEVEKKLVDGAATADGANKKNGSNVIPSEADTSNTLVNPSSSSSTTTTTTSLPVVATATKTKNPDEASTYLSLWKYDRSTTNNNKNANKHWKFNKNTQSWLLRHMYNPTKVSKHSFSLLVEYLLHGENDGVKNRVLEDAKFRARRYKEFEKQLQQQHPSKIQDRDGAEAKGVAEIGVGKNENNNKEQSKKADQSSLSNKMVAVDWKAMDEHDKRKEYKRARKVLDAFKAAVMRDGEE